MAFINNSGDIIFDVVLTDEGRRLLAKGDGSFNVVKFALGDDEINYGLYDTTAATAQQDIEILQSPIFEAFTNNTSVMSSMLLSIPRNNLFYLPVLKVNEICDGTSTKFHTQGVMHVAVDANTENNNFLSSGTTALAFGPNGLREGFILGFSSTRPSNYIRVDAGIDNDAVPPETNIADLFLDENSYSIELDNRLGSIISKDGATRIRPSSIDDDNIAMYVVSAETDPKIVYTNMNSDSATSSNQVIAGARSTYLEFRIASSINLRQSDFLFNRLGSTASDLPGKNGVNQTYKFIDTLVKITGINTGYSIDLPIRFVKLT
tara:strand:+ start:2316 stop:3275 length:960 start_codon:yes stop_codon:yes gene_type:complete